MAKVIVQMIETELPNGWKEMTIVVRDTETGETNSGSTQWFLDCDRAVRIDYLRNNLLR